MIYHILNDEKFSDWVIDCFKQVNPNNNRFIVVSDTHIAQHVDKDQIEFFTNDQFSQLDVQSSDLVIFYFLHIHNIDFLLRRNVDFKTLWVGYGADYYYYLLNEDSHFGSLYLPESDRIYKSINNRSLVRRFLLPIYQRAYFHFKVKRALKNVQFFAPIIPNEYKMIKQDYPFFTFKHVNFTFGDIEYLLGSYLSSSVSGNKILIGNSATIANNHFDVLKIVKNVDIDNQLVIPLSYGNQKYKTVLQNYCATVFGSQAEMLNDFIPKQEYFNLLRECQFVIMGHLRQQAMGNIYASLYMGAKLFLYKRNPVFDFLKGLGILVFEIEELNCRSEHLKTPLSFAEKSRNRAIINDYYSRSAVQERIKDILFL